VNRLARVALKKFVRAGNLEIRTARGGATSGSGRTSCCAIFAAIWGNSIGAAARSAMSRTTTISTIGFIRSFPMPTALVSLHSWQCALVPTSP